MEYDLLLLLLGEGEEKGRKGRADEMKAERRWSAFANSS